MTITRTDEEIARVENWAAEGVDAGTNYPGMSYEQGVLDALQWLIGDSDHAPDDD